MPKRHSHSVRQELLVVSLLSASIAGIVTMAGISMADESSGIGLSTGGAVSAISRSASQSNSRSSEYSIPSNQSRRCWTDACVHMTYVEGTPAAALCSTDPDIKERCENQGTSHSASSANGGNSSGGNTSSGGASSAGGDTRCLDMMCVWTTDRSNCPPDQAAMAQRCGSATGGQSGQGNQSFCLTSTCTQTTNRDLCGTLEEQRKCYDGSQGGQSTGGESTSRNSGGGHSSGGGQSGGEDTQGGSQEQQSGGEQNTIRIDMQQGGQQTVGPAGVTVIQQAPITPEFQARMDAWFHRQQESEEVTVQQVASVAVQRLETVREHVKDDPLASARIDAIIEDVREAQQEASQEGRDEAKQAEDARVVQGLIADAADAAKKANVQRPEEAVLLSQRDAAAALLRNMWEDLVPVRDLLAQYGMPVPPEIDTAQLSVGRILEQIPSVCRSALCPQILAGRDQMIAVGAAVEGTVHTDLADDPGEQDAFMRKLREATEQNN